jgi:hypothetical protein
VLQWESREPIILHVCEKKYFIGDYLTNSKNFSHSQRNVFIHGEEKQVYDDITSRYFIAALLTNLVRKKFLSINGSLKRETAPVTNQFPIK